VNDGVNSAVAQRIVGLLSDGAFHSGVELADTLRVSRAAIWKMVEHARHLGVPVSAVRGRGYRLAASVRLLNRDDILSELTVNARKRLQDRVEIPFSVDSTNQALLGRARNLPEPIAMLTELQTAGRGRWRRPWWSSFGSGLTMSLAWPFPNAGRGGLGGLSLAVAVGLVTALRDAGASGISIKWPNDLLYEGRKLGGILVELQGEAGGAWVAVTGLGLNLTFGAGAPDGLNQPVVAFERIVGKTARDRSKWAAITLSALVETCERFETLGFEPFWREWAAFDYLAERDVTLRIGSTEVEGRGAGIDETGRLLVATRKGTIAYSSGDPAVKVTS